MSYLHPTADVNSAGQELDPLRGDRLRRAEDGAYEALRHTHGNDPDNPFASWQRFSEDVLHYRRFDDLPQEQQDHIRARRRLAYRNSDVPWILTDYTTLLTAYDDVDDLLKTKTLIKDYALTPAARAATRLARKRPGFKDEKLEGWDEACGVPAPPRERKLVVPGFGGLNFLSALGLGALGLLFPSWRLAALLLQALQTTDSLFGVGLQLGPILGYAMEKAFRGLKDIGGPLFDFENKYEQLKAARVMQNGNKALAAAPHAHPDDAFTSLTGFYYASDADIIPQLVIDQDDYPSVAQVFDNPWSPVAVGENLAKEGFDAFRLALSLPYNLGALAVNNLLGDALAGMSKMLGGPGADGMVEFTPDNEAAGLMRLAEAGICPASQCEGELAMDAYLLFNREGRRDPQDGNQLTKQDLARRLNLRVQDPTTLANEK